MHIMHIARETRYVSYSEWRNGSQFPSHRHSGLSMMELGFVVAFIYIAPYIELCKSDSSAIMHRYARLVARGSRHAYICEIHCCAPFLLSVAANQESAVFRGLARFPKTIAKQRLIGASSWISARRQPGHASFIIWRRVKTVPGLHASLLFFLVNL